MTTPEERVDDVVRGDGGILASPAGLTGPDETGPQGPALVAAAADQANGSLEAPTQPGEPSHPVESSEPGAPSETAAIMNDAGDDAPESGVDSQSVDSDDIDGDEDTNDTDDTDGDDSADDDSGDPDEWGEGAPTSTSGRGRRVAELEREGEVAADFLERLLDIADLDGDIDVDIDGDRAAVAIVDSEEGRVPRRLVGPDGRVLEALQELTRLAVQTATGERSRLMLDVAGYRADRRAALVTLARSAIEEVRSTGQPKPLSAMSAFERKVVHDEVTAAGLHSESEGMEPHRHIVISTAG